MQETYKVPKGEEKYYHCLMEIKAFRLSQYGEPVKISSPFIQKFEPKWFKSVGFHELKQQGYSIEILHDPYEYEAKAESEAKAEAEAKAKAEADAMMQQLREDIEREVRAELAAASAKEGEEKPEAKRGRKPKEETKE